MVNNYKRKTTRQSWDKENMRSAIQKIVTDKLSLNKAAAEYNVPKTTLKRRLAKYHDTQDIDKATERKMGRFEQVFNVEQERELTTYVKLMESRFFGLTTKDLRKLAYELAQKNNLKHNFDHNPKMAGRIWLENFLKRNSDLSLRKPEPTSAAGATGFNKVVINKFFDLLNDLVTKYNFTPNRIFNVDETGMTTVPKTMPRIIGTKGKKQVGLLTSAERGQLVTVEFCMGADGSYMPPLFIFPRKRFKPELMNNAPRESWALCHESGWIQKDIFTAWFNKFIQFSRASPNNPVLLLLDGHASHTKNMDVIDLGRQHGVHTLSFPPHCTHRLQPLDVGFMKPLSTYYTEAATNWMSMNTGRVITQFQVAELVSKAFEKTATLTTAYNAFQATGIWPINRDVFTEADFLAAATSDIEMSSSKINERADDFQPSTSRVAVESFLSINNETLIIDNSQTSKTRFEPHSFSEFVSETNNIDDSQPSTSRIEPQSSSSKASETSTISNSQPRYKRDQDEPQPSTSQNIKDKQQSMFLVHPSDVMPFPKTSKTKRSSVKRGKTVVLTSSSYREELETTQKIMIDKIKKKIGKGKGDGKAKGKGKGKVTNKKDNDTSEEESEDVQCFYCLHLYSESSEGWVQYVNCGLTVIAPVSTMKTKTLDLFVNDVPKRLVHFAFKGGPFYLYMWAERTKTRILEIIQYLFIAVI